MNDELPEGWAETTIEECLHLINGFPFKPTQWSEKGLPIIRIQNLNDPHAPFNHCDEDLPEKIKIRHDDLVFAWSGTPGTSFGAHIWNGGDAWLNQHIFRVEFNPLLFDKVFLRHAININLNQYIADAHGGAGLAHITKGKFEASTLRVAPFDEQRRIVSQVEALLAKVRSCQGRLDTIPTILKRFRQSVLAAACTGKLTADWRRSKGVPESNGVTDDVPASWRPVCVGDVIDGLKYGTAQKCTPEKHGMPVLRIPNVAKGTIDHTDLKYAVLPPKERESLRLIPGDILIIRSNGSVALVGRSALVRKQERGFAYAGYLIRIRARQELITPRFLNLVLGSYDVRFQIELEARSTSGVNNINSEEVRALHFRLPPVEEQDEIVCRVEALLSVGDRLEARYAKTKVQVDRLTQSVLAKAFRGELVPTEAELARREGRSYETAEELLVRIKNAQPTALDHGQKRRNGAGRHARR